MLAKVHSFESFGTVDGPGVRFVIFLKGCPLRCKYCHNPDTWTQDNSKLYDVETIISEVLKYKNYFGKYGGVTVSGGEPLLQIDFLIEFFTKLKELGINTCCDTSGCVFDKNNRVLLDKFDKLISVTDLFLLDIKHINNDEHIKLTGKKNSNILDFANYLSINNKKMWIRHVIVPGITLNQKYLLELKDFLKNLNGIEKVEILPYHTFGVKKYDELGIKYELKDVNPPTNDDIKEVEDLFSIFNKK